MLIGGYQKLTLIDYPGKIAATVFTSGCNFRCPFCHNPELVLGFQSPSLDISEKEFFEFLGKRKEKLEGICITGGEPTIQPDLIDFAGKVKKMGFFVKLDTNGTRPDVVSKMLQKGLVDYIAMDIKNTPQNYSRTANIRSLDIERIKLSVELIRNSRIDYEFRTTVVPGIHQMKDFEEIGKWLRGSNRYFLQKFRNARTLNPAFRNADKGKSLDLEKIQNRMKEHFHFVGIRE